MAVKDSGGARNRRRGGGVICEIDSGSGKLNNVYIRFMEITVVRVKKIIKSRTGNLTCRERNSI